MSYNADGNEIITFGIVGCSTTIKKDFGKGLPDTENPCWKLANVKQQEQVMSKFNAIVARFLREEEGASLIEYSILIGLITALVIAIIVVVGTWVQNAWSDLNAQLG
jgi:pilus assembly protein Flp/PilA